MRLIRLREARAVLSSLIEDAARGEGSIITSRGEPRAVLVGIDEWNRLSRVPSFGHLLLASGLEDDDLPPRDAEPLQDASL